MTSRPLAEPSDSVGVRVAWATDAVPIAQVQVRAWRNAYADALPAALLQALDVEQFATQWHETIATPREARHRVLVALDGTDVAGFALTTPATDPDAQPGVDAEVAEFRVDPERTRRGHGSRLLQACVDTMRADRFTRATAWVSSTDDGLRRFLASAGWGPDGAHRELDLTGDGSVTVKQVRLHTDLREG